jgi:hypothetical protein
VDPATATPMSLLAGACVTLSGVAVFLFYRLEKANEKIQSLLVANKDEVKTLQQETIRITVAQTEKHFEANAPVLRLLESTIGKTQPR